MVTTEDRVLFLVWRVAKLFSLSPWFHFKFVYFSFIMFAVFLERRTRHIWRETRRKKRKNKEEGREKGLKNEVERFQSGRVFWTRAKGSLSLPSSVNTRPRRWKKGERNLIRREKLTTMHRPNRTCAIRNVQFLQVFVRQRELPQDLVAIWSHAYAELLQQRHPL